MNADLISTNENLANGNPVEIRFHNNNDPTSAKIRDILDLALEKYGKKDLSEHMKFYAATLIHHAEKENVKNAFFRSNNIDPSDMGHYVLGLTRFRAIDGKEEYFHFYERLKEMDLWVDLKLDHSKDGICLQIVNNSPMPDIEEMWLRIKMKKSMLYNYLLESKDILDDGLYFGDPGIGLIAMLMQKAKLDARLFRVGTRGGSTFSRIEIPFTENYTPVRRYMKMDA